MEIFKIAVGFTNSRPVIPEEFTSFVIIAEENLTKAKMAAAQMVGCRAEMVTSTTLIEVRI